MRKKICVVVASRANYGRIKAVMSAINEHPDLELQLIVGASALLYRYGKVVDLIEQDSFEVSSRIYSIVEARILRLWQNLLGLVFLSFRLNLKTLNQILF